MIVWFKYAVAFASAVGLLVAQSASAITYSKISATRVEIGIDAREVLASAQPSTEKAVGDLIGQYRTNEFNEQYTYDHGHDPIAKDLAMDQRLYDDMQAEMQFWNTMDSLAKTFGVAAMAGAAVHITNQLKQLNALAPARLAAVLAGAAAVAAEGTTQAIAGRKSSLQARMTALSTSMSSTAKYLAWQMDYGGQGSPPTTMQCLIKESCVDTKVCVTQGSARDCQEKPVCQSEILQCTDR